jgi:nucleoside-diphosphate-sugar epimerase
MTESSLRVLVTGAAGRVGRAVLADLASAGTAVTALTLEDPGDLKADRVVVGDAGDPATVRRALADADAVIHLAALPSPRLGSPEDVFTGNARATFVVLEEAGRAGVRSAAIASSICVLGLVWAAGPRHPAYVPVDVRTPLQVEDPYGLSKQADEATAAMMNRRHGMNVVALRFPYLGDTEVLAARAEAFRADPAGGAGDLWAYLDLRDAAAACRLALTPAEPGCHVLFVAADQTLAPYPTRALLDRFHPGSERRAEVAGRDVPIALGPARRMIGFTARHPLAAVPGAAVPGGTDPGPEIPGPTDPGPALPGPVVPATDV